MNKEAILNNHFLTIKNCQKCPLAKDRNQVVYGKGNPKAKIVFIGEAPGEQEDVQGLPFVGRAGQLLTRLLKEVDFNEEDIYIANICKCRPPNNRPPTEIEINTCKLYLFFQLGIIKPEVIVCLGRTAVIGLLRNIVDINDPILSLRKQDNIHLELEVCREDSNEPLRKKARVFITYHPSFVLRNNNYRSEVTKDLLAIKSYVEGVNYAK